jgi:hypothetical protein
MGWQVRRRLFGAAVEEEPLFQMCDAETREDVCQRWAGSLGRGGE